jgi:hypothetical protein
MCGASAADDVVQETFLAVLRQDGFDSSRGTVAAYLFGIARHLICRRLAAAQNARRRSSIKMLILAGGLTVSSLVPIWQLAIRQSHTVLDAPQQTNAEMVTAFFPLAYSSVPMADGRLVRVEVPREAMLAFGLEYVNSNGGAVSPVVLADILVGEDGLARAVRFVRPLEAEPKREFQP